ncbi:MAG: glycosyltransferase family 4 protein [Planctomycetaceae bacterium]|nr:glycosyltransferase family 4 protein [Planctomycetaceae bacterium]
MEEKVISRLKGYVRRAEFEWNQFRWKIHTWRNQRIFDGWYADYVRSRPEVIVGANFHTSGGVRNHMHAIADYSKLRTLLVPDDRRIRRFGTLPFNENAPTLRQRDLPSSLRAIHTHVLPWLIDWAIERRTPDVVWVHTHHAWYFPEYGVDGIEPWQHSLNQVGLTALKKCDVRLSVSRWQQRFLRSEHGIDAAYLPNGVDVLACDQGRADRFYRKYDAASPFILWVGRFDPVKNPHDYVRLALTLPTHHFVMVGGITASHIASDMQLPLPANLSLMPPLGHSEVQNVIAACRALVVTSHREGLPTLVLEAMTHQKPVVIPDEDGCMDATNGQEHAYVYRKGDVAHLADQVRNALAGPETMPRSRERILDEFDWRVVAEKLDAIYQGKTR